MNTAATPHDNLDAYTITFRREILFYLRQLINDGEHISAQFNDGQDSLLTMLLDIDEEENLLYLDWGGSEDTNDRFLKCKRCIFVANPQGIRNQFITGKPHEVTYKNRRAFAVTLPSQYVRLQRREFFRLVLPMTRRPLCRLALADAGEEQTLPIIDIGLGGVRLEAPTAALPLVIGQILPKAAIDLKGPTVMRLDLEVRYLGQLARGNRQVGQIGCRFAALSAGQEHELHKFITLIQSEEREKLG